MKDFRVALVQMDSQQNKEENLRKMEERTSVTETVLVT